MTTHPVELIAGMDDGIELEQNDEVTRHIAACDACRGVARTMQRIDRLIATPEPALPLPARVAPQRHVPVAGWAAVVAVVLTLAVVTGALVQSSRQRQVATSAADTCGVLADAARSSGVDASTAKTSAIRLPSTLSGSWSACGYGDGATRGGPWLLFRTVPTATWEFRGLLRGLSAADPEKQFVFGNFVRRTGVTETWITEEGTRPPGTGQATAVVADPYAFVVTAPSRAAADRLADAIVAELRRWPWPPVSEAKIIDPCDVINRASPPANRRSPAGVGRHWAEVPLSEYGTLGFIFSNSCSFYDDVGHDQHIWIREEPTTPQQAANLLPVISASLSYSTVGDWVQVEDGMWLMHGYYMGGDCPTCPRFRVDFSTIAVLDAPNFFAFTEATDESAIRLARAVMVEVKRP